MGEGMRAGVFCSMAGRVRVRSTVICSQQGLHFCHLVSGLKRVQVLGFTGFGGRGLRGDFD